MPPNIFLTCVSLGGPPSISDRGHPQPRPLHSTRVGKFTLSQARQTHEPSGKVAAPSPSLLAAFAIMLDSVPWTCACVREPIVVDPPQTDWQTSSFSRSISNPPPRGRRGDTPGEVPGMVGGPPSTSSRGFPQVRPLHNTREGKFTLRHERHTQEPGGGDPSPRTLSADMCRIVSC